MVLKTIYFSLLPRENHSRPSHVNVVRLSYFSTQEAVFLVINLKPLH